MTGILAGKKVEFFTQMNLKRVFNGRFAGFLIAVCVSPIHNGYLQCRIAMLEPRVWT